MDMSKTAVTGSNKAGKKYNWGGKAPQSPLMAPDPRGGGLLLADGT